MTYKTKTKEGKTYHYTGLEDKEGNELWEYDIVELTRAKLLYIVLLNIPQHRYGIIALKTYLKQRDRVKNYSSFQRYLTPLDVLQMKKIGSTHENPEWLI